MVKALLWIWLLALSFFALLVAKELAEAETKHQELQTRDLSLAILYTRDLYGHAELCGCSPAQHGGLPRQSAFFHAYENKNRKDAVLKVDCGNFSPKTDDPAQEIRLAQMIKGLSKLNYDAINIGVLEASHSGAVLQKLRNSGLPLTSTNLVDPDGKLIFPPFRIKNRNGIKIAFLGILGKQISHENVRVLQPAEALRRALSALGPQRPNLILLLGDLDTNQAVEIANQFKELSLVLSAKDLSFSPRTAAYIAPWSGEYGKNVGVALLKYNNGLTSFRSTFSPLSSKVESDEALKKVVDEARIKVESELKTKPHLSKSADQWIGSARCQACHSIEYDIWKRTSHNMAIKILREQHADSRFDCIFCHVTGYNLASRSYAEEGVGCEACHGPGKEHADHFAGKVKEAPAMNATASVCAKCHDEPNSPLFSFNYYWEKIKH